MKFKILCLILFSSAAFGLSCPKSFDVKKIAKEVLKAEFSGIRVDGMQGHKCIQQGKFPYVLATHDSSNEEASEPQYTISREEEVKITSVKLVDKSSYEYEVSFSVNGIDIDSKKKVLHSDKILLNLFKDNRNISISGCAAVLGAPEKIAIYRDCYTP